MPRDAGAGWEGGPDLDHYSNRTRHALQYMNPNKINMDLVLDLLDYLGKLPQGLQRQSIHFLPHVFLVRVWGVGGAIPAYYITLHVI